MSYKVTFNALRSAFKNYSFELNRKIADINNELKKCSAEGSLRISMSSHGKQTFYHYNEETKENKYIRRKEESLRTQLAKKDFCIKAKSSLEKQKAILTQLSEAINENDIIKNYAELHPARQALIMDRDLDDKAFVHKWEAQTGTQQNGYEIKGDSYTLKGEHVRSKSEKIIADTLFHKGIPYKYEKPLTLKTGEIVFPDFTALNVRERKTYYIEHLGMMMDPAYAIKNIEKIEKYEANGIWPGESLLLTMEGGEKSLNSRIVEAMIDNFLM